MRTTVTLDPDTEQTIRRRMRERGISFKEAINEAIRASVRDDATPRPFVTDTAAMGRPTVNLDRALQVVGELEDDDLVRRMRARLVKLVDANVLLYAVNTDADHHERSRRWLDEALSGADTVAFAWIALLAFVRLATKEGLFPSPLTIDEAMDRIDVWLGAGPSVVVEPTADHPRIVRRFLQETGVGANLVNDAHVAALALEHRCTIVSFDNDFGRFGDVEWVRPEV